MSEINDELIQKARNADLADYFQRSGYECELRKNELHVKGYGGLFVNTQTNEWFCFSQQGNNRGGKNPVNCLTDVLGIDFKTAVEQLSGGYPSALYHICEFAERLEKSHGTVIPLRSSLPEQCYSVLPDTGELIIINKGEAGYYRSNIDMGSKTENRALADAYNAKLGVSKAQEQAMSAGSMFGWQVPGADPKNYDENGKPIRPKNRERGSAR